MFLRPWNAAEAGGLLRGDGFRSRMERLFGEMESLFGAGAGAMPWAGWPGMDLWETDAAYIAESEIPGASADDVEVVTEGNQLTLKVRRPEPELPEGAVLHRRERPFGEFTRTITLPAPVDAASVTAEIRNGVLTLTMPKQESARPRRIEVRAADKALEA